MPRRIFPASTVTNTTGAPLRLTFHVTSTSTRRETDLWTVDGSSYLSAQIPNGVILTDASGAYSAFAGPDDIDVLYVGANGGSRSAITATSSVATSSAAAARSDLGLGAAALLSTAQIAADSALTAAFAPISGSTVYAPSVATIYLPVPRIGITNSSVVSASAGMLRAWALRDANNDHLGQEVQFPSSWATYNLDVKLTALSAGNGDSVLRLDTFTLSDASNGNASLTTGSQVTITLPNQFIVKVARVATNVAVDPAGENFCRVIRLGNDAADTATGSVGILGMKFTKSS